jgi:hypothetical protein
VISPVNNSLLDNASLMHAHTPSRWVVTAIVCLISSIPSMAQDDRFVITVKGKHGYISHTGEVAIPPLLEGTYVTDFEEGMALFAESANPTPPKVPFVDQSGRAHIFLWEKWGFINTSGKNAIPAIYHSAKNFHEGLAAVGLDTERTRYDCLHCDPNLKWGFIDKSGSIVVAPQFHGAAQFSQGLAAVQNAELKWGFIDRSGHLAIPFAFDFAGTFSEGLAVVGVMGKYGFIDRTGAYAVPLRFTWAREFSNGLAPVRLGGKRINPGEPMKDPLGGRWAFIDSKGELKIKLPKRVADTRPFREGRAVVTFRSSCGYVDSSGTFISKPDLQYCEDFSEGRAAVFNGSWQYIDLSGRVVLKTNYFQIGSFVNGLARVTVGELGPNQRFGYINKDGVEVYKPQPAL